jgi:hypothetical protein
MSGVLIAFGSAIIGAIVGAYLQKRWMPDPSAEIAGLRKQVTAFQQRIETLELERAESEHLRVSMSLQQGAPGSYIMPVKNDSDEEVAAEGVNLVYDDVELSNPTGPKSTDSWKIAPHSGKQICWAPEPDPVRTLMLMEPSLGSGTPIAIQLVLFCRIRGKPKALRRKQLVTVDYLNRQMTPFGP